MSLNLPKPIAAYFAADKGDSKALARCFTENAIVKDEGHTYNGLAAIKKWKAEGKYTYTRSLSRLNRRTERLSSPAGLPAIFPAAPPTFVSSSNSKATRS